MVVYCFIKFLHIVFKIICTFIEICGIITLVEKPLYNRIILHCDLNNFFASVECQLNPELKKVPMAVTGDADKRHGIILAKNDLAKKYGVKTAEVIWEAKQKAPGLVCVPPHQALYEEYSKEVLKIYGRFTPIVESFGIDECWLDLTGYMGGNTMENGKIFADKIRETIKKETGLTASVGVSYNKIFAKMGSDLNKPDATTVITKENFQRLLWGLTVGELFMVGKKTAEHLRKLNIYTIGDIAFSDKNMLKQHFGIMGEKHIENARGENTEPVVAAADAKDEKSVSNGMTPEKDITTFSDAEKLIYLLSEKVSSRMRQYNIRGKGVSLDLRGNDLKHVSRQKKLDFYTCSGSEIALAAIDLLNKNWKFNPIRTLTLGVFDLTKEKTEVQLSLFDENIIKHDRSESLEKTLDKIKNKYGTTIIQRGNLFSKDDFSKIELPKDGFLGSKPQKDDFSRNEPPHEKNSNFRKNQEKSE